MPVALRLHPGSLDAQPSAPLLLLVALKLSSPSPPHPLLQVLFIFPGQLSTLLSLWGWRAGFHPPRVWDLAGSWFCILSTLDWLLGTRVSHHPDPGPAVSLDSLLQKELRVLQSMRPGPGTPVRLFPFSPIPCSILITSALSALVRTSGALSHLPFPTATVLTWGSSGPPWVVVIQTLPWAA